MRKVALKHHFEPKMALRKKINEGMGFKELLNRQMAKQHRIAMCAGSEEWSERKMGSKRENKVLGRSRHTLCRQEFDG